MINQYLELIGELTGELTGELRGKRRIYTLSIAQLTSKNQITYDLCTVSYFHIIGSIMFRETHVWVKLLQLEAHISILYSELQYITLIHRPHKEFHCFRRT